MFTLPPALRTIQQFFCVFMEDTVQRRYGLSGTSDREGFIAVYPQGLGRHWNDGRIDPGDVSDVEFIESLLGSLSVCYRIDPGE